MGKYLAYAFQKTRNCLLRKQFEIAILPFTCLILFSCIETATLISYSKKKSEFLKGNREFQNVSFEKTRNVKCSSSKNVSRYVLKYSRKNMNKFTEHYAFNYFVIILFNGISSKCSIL